MAGGEDTRLDGRIALMVRRDRRLTNRDTGEAAKEVFYSVALIRDGRRVKTYVCGDDLGEMVTLHEIAVRAFAAEMEDEKQDELSEGSRS